MPYVFLGINYFQMLNIQHNRHVHKIVLQITRGKKGVIKINKTYTEYIQSIFIHLNLTCFINKRSSCHTRAAARTKWRYHCVHTASHHNKKKRKKKELAAAGT